MPASSSPICSRAPASTAWPHEVNVNKFNRLRYFEQKAGQSLPGPAFPDETNETIDDTTRKNPAVTTTTTNADLAFQVLNLQVSDQAPPSHPRRPGRDAPLRVVLRLGSFQRGRRNRRCPIAKTPHKHVTRTKCDLRNAAPLHAEVNTGHL